MWESVLTNPPLEVGSTLFEAEPTNLFVSACMTHFTGSCIISTAESTLTVVLGYCVGIACPLSLCFQEGRTALHIQAAKGNTSMLKFLIAQFNPDLEAISQVGGLQHV